MFDGTKPHYLADDQSNPLTEYGKQKAEVENLFLSTNGTSAAIRLAKSYLRIISYL